MARAVSRPGFRRGAAWHDWTGPQGVPRTLTLVTSSFLFLVVMPGATGSDALCFSFNKRGVQKIDLDRSEWRSKQSFGLPSFKKWVQDESDPET